MSPRVHQVFLLSFCFQFLIIAALTHHQDANWVGSDPCGLQWEGIDCSGTRVTSIKLANLGLIGELPENITALSELQTLDLSFNKELEGHIPSTIGNLTKLINLILVGCSFSGQIPDSIRYLQQLAFLSLNSNRFSGYIPPSIGLLSKLIWLDLTDNQIEGPIPVSDEVSPGLDMLVHTNHFHLGMNELSGPIPEKLFSSNMELIHVILNTNRLTGPLPSSLGLVKSLLVVELSNNSFDAQTIPSWFSKLPKLTRLVMEQIGLEGEVPADIFSLPELETVILKSNKLNGTLDISKSHSNRLQSINMQYNSIHDFKPGWNKDVTVILADNPICLEYGSQTESYCSVSNQSSSYTTPPKDCLPPSCSGSQTSSPTCKCANPYRGTLKFVAPSFSGIGSETYYEILRLSILEHFHVFQLPVDSVSLSNPRKEESSYFEISLAVFPAGQDSFNATGLAGVAHVFSQPTYPPPSQFGPYFFFGESYLIIAGESITRSVKSTSIGVIIGAAVGSCVLLILLLLAGVYAYRQKMRAEIANKQNPFAHWDLNKSSGSVPQLKGARCFSLEELNKYTNHFSEANNIGCGGYGKAELVQKLKPPFLQVYKGILPTGQLIAIKRAQLGSMQGEVEFRTEIELLSRVHHKNLVMLLGFCFERGEQMLIYEYIVNGSLRDSLSGKSGIKLDWIRRLKLALGASRGVAYLHEFANPPIIHRDIKSTNILLDERLTTKVSDFGISKTMGDNEKHRINTQVKGTMGYLDPEYYMTQQLTEKSDVYSFGVLMLELLTGKRPLERGKYIVREVKMAMDKQKDLYNLYEILDPTIDFGTTIKGLEKFVDLAMRCVEESGVDRPPMSEVVKEIENILQLAGLNPNADSTSTSTSYDHETFDYSCPFTPSKIEPK